MRIERSRAACCCFAGPTCRGTYFRTVAASMLQAALDKCRSYLSFMDRTAERDASYNNRRNQQRLKRRLLNRLKQFTEAQGGLLHLVSLTQKPNIGGI